MKFPFEPSRIFTIGQLRSFEAELLVVRQGDPALSKVWRVPNTAEMKRWVKLREETYPIKLLAEHKRYPDHATFMLAARGAPNIDAEIDTGAEQFKLQITIADPIWVDDHGNASNGGYDHRLSMEELNKGGFVHGSSLMQREGRTIISKMPVRSFEQEFNACKTGLIQALERKFPKSLPGCRLLIHARGYSQRTIDFSFEEVARSAISEVQREIGSSSFEKFYFVDQESYFEI